MSAVRAVTKFLGGVHGSYMAVTQGMGQGRVRGERMTLVAIVHWKDEDFCTSFHYSFTVR